MTTLHVVESKAMEAGLVAASAAELAEGIDRDGHVSVYNLHFDTGKAGLSAQRASSVVRALTGNYEVAADRLIAQGAGPLAPVASNRNDDGKAKNRRVDLVEQ